MLELSFPGLFIAGLYASPHCATMCAGLNLRHAQRPTSWGQAQALRLAGYTLLGAIAGWLGGQFLLWLPTSISVSRVGMGLGLLVLAAVVWRGGLRSNSCADKHGLQLNAGGQPQAEKPWWAAAWVLMPCPALAVATGAATISGGAVAGASLLLAFGLGTLPAHAGQLLLFRRWGSVNPQLARRVGGGLIFLNGLWLISLWLLDDGSSQWRYLCSL